MTVKHQRGVALEQEGKGEEEEGKEEEEGEEEEGEENEEVVDCE